MNSINKKWFKLLDDSKLKKVLEVSSILGINPNWLLATMYFETAKTFSPSKTNSIGSVGLIQFTRDKAGVEYKTINGRRYNLSDIKKMDFNEQMDLVYLYYAEQMKGKRITSHIDTYLVTFFPEAIGKPLDYVLKTKRLSESIIAKQNPVFNSNKDGKITKKEIVDFFDSYYKKQGFDYQKEINLNTDSFGRVLLPLLVFFYSLLSLSI